MAVSSRLGLRQSQALALTPKFKQAIKFLQLSSLELTAYVAEALDQTRCSNAALRSMPATGRIPATPGDAFDRAPSPGANLSCKIADERYSNIVLGI